MIPLLRLLGCRTVVDLQGSGEKGIDLYFEWPDVFGHLRRFGMQLKVTGLRRTAKPSEDSNLITICNQIQMGFGREIICPLSRDGKVSVTIDGFYVVTTKQIHSSASEFIYENRRTYPYIQLLEGRDIISVIQNPSLPTLQWPMRTDFTPRRTSR